MKRLLSFLMLLSFLSTFYMGYVLRYYTIKKGDTLSVIAQKLNASVSSILDINLMIDADKIYAGEKIMYVKPDGVFQTINKNQALWYIAAEYFTTIKDILSNNSIKNPNLIFPGQKIFIPLNIMCKTSNKKTGVIWPVFGEITSPYGWRINPITHKKEFHAGVDIGAPEGTPVFSAIRGVVTYAGWYGGYGNMIQIFDGHMLTRYGHLSKIDCYVGEHVKQGMLIGRIGSTGLSTGPHLHFEIRIKGTPYNPLGYLPYAYWSGEGKKTPTPFQEGMGY
ncbi:peptidoglycan DD-metalloendopeptidase family protein [Mesoaciditoga lauensis]|uniref:peptidoglycan DD-metalloendopeptidase family protein n=1 Tax=Mesoaciditoga lauensis TaxID=1495039 RepID=UPI00068B6104|nr:M23 family metallopeptidase [Mesoaciditoga lauensis]